MGHGAHTLPCCQSSRCDSAYITALLPRKQTGTGRTPGLKRQGGQAEGLQLRRLLFRQPSRAEPHHTGQQPPCSSSVILEGPSTRPPRKARHPLRTFCCHLLNPQSSSMCGEHGLPAARYRQAPEPLQGKHISRGHLQRAQPDGGCCTSPHLRIRSKRRHRRYTLQVHPGQRETCETPVLAPIQFHTCPSLHEGLLTPRNLVPSWPLLFPGSKCTLAYGTELNLWQTKQHGLGAVAEERKYQGTGITAPPPCLASGHAARGKKGNQSCPPNTEYPLTPTFHPG